MINKKKAILIGDIEKAPYHSLKGFDKEFKEILSDFDIFSTTNHELFKVESLKQYDLCISFIDRWAEKLSDEQTAGLLSFVIYGGGLLIAHNGISVQLRHELAQLAGGKFIGHPEQKVLTYKPTTVNHFIIEGIESFSVKEEPYQFILDNIIDSKILLEYELEGKMWPAAWAHSYGFGKVVCLSPGHNLSTLLDPTYRKIISRSGKWLTNLE